MKDLEQFDKLSSDITLFVAPALKVTVKDIESSGTAIEIAKQLKSFLTSVDKKRKELVGPLNERVKTINDYAKKIVAPLEEADSHIRSELNQFATKQEEIRRAEEARIERERIEAEAKMRAERERIEEEMRVNQESEAAAHAEAVQMFGSGDVEVEQANQSVDEKLAREWADKQVELDRKEAILNIEHTQQKYDARKTNISNARATWFCEATDLTQVPKEFLIVELNKAAVLAAAKAGVTIPGVRVWTEMKVAIGSTTRAPRLAGGE